MKKRPIDEDESWVESTGRFHELDDSENPWDEEELIAPDPEEDVLPPGGEDGPEDEIPEDMPDDEEEDIPESSGLVYMDPKTLLEDIQKYYSTNVFPKRLADSIFTIARRMANRGNFCNYSWRDEMILDGYEKMAMAIYNRKFDIAKNYSPFSYLSRICWRCFVLKIKQEKRRKDAEKNFREQQYDRIRAENSGLSFTEEMLDGERIYVPDDGRITEEFEMEADDD